MNISNKVLNSVRDISFKDKEEPEEFDEKIIVVSPFQAKEKIVSTIKESEESFKQTQSFRTKPGPLFKFVKKSWSKHKMPFE